MDYLMQRQVGSLVVQIKTNSFYRVIFHGSEIRISDTLAKVLWILAEYPDQLIPLVDLYKAMYGARPSEKRPYDESVLRVYTSQLRKTLQNIAGHDDKHSHIICDFRGGVGLYSEPQLKVKKAVGPNPGVGKAIEAARLS